MNQSPENGQGARNTSGDSISPSLGTPGEGWGGGCVETARSCANGPHPNPPPEYRRRGQDSSPQVSRTPEQAVDGACILIADDDTTILEMLSARFSAAGFKPLLATNGQAALETAVLMHPAIVLLDEQLPGLPGSQVCEHLASDRQTAHIPVIIITGHRRVASTPANLQMIVTKPFSAENLVATVIALVRRAKLISAA